jgi:hypothetical protein
MRQSKKKYFVTRDPTVLKDAKAKEKMVDDYIDRCLDAMTGMSQQGELYK